MLSKVHCFRVRRHITSRGRTHSKVGRESGLTLGEDECGTLDNYTYKLNKHQKHFGIPPVRWECLAKSAEYIKSFCSLYTWIRNQKASGPDRPIFILAVLAEWAIRGAGGGREDRLRECRSACFACLGDLASRILCLD